MRISRLGNILENMKFFRKPLQKARNRFFSQIQLYDPSGEIASNPSNLDRFRSEVLQEGFLRVQGRGFRRKTNPRSWKEMYAVLEESRLFLFDHKNDETPKFIIPLDESVGIFREDVQHRETYHCMRLSSQFLNCSMCAGSDDERDQWMTMMLTVISEKVLSGHGSRPNVRHSMYY